jgi:hypothetical protein
MARSSLTDVRGNRSEHDTEFNDARSLALGPRNADDPFLLLTSIAASSISPEASFAPIAP